MLTEAEARERWCPFARVVGYVGNREKGILTPACNRTLDSEAVPRVAPASKCLASACMAWRWAPDEFEPGELVKLRRGYCGLAGKP